MELDMSLKEWLRNMYLKANVMTDTLVSDEFFEYIQRHIHSDVEVCIKIDVVCTSSLYREYVVKIVLAKGYKEEAVVVGKFGNNPKETYTFRRSLEGIVDELKNALEELE